MTPQDRIAEARKSLLSVQKELTEVLAKNKSRARAPAVRMLHEVRGMLQQGFPYASQAGQDQVVDRIMKGKTGGTFVDVGGYDGVNGSNTLFLEKWRGWTGLLVEPVKAQRAKAETIRTCQILPYAVAPNAGQADFLSVTRGFTQMSGLMGSYNGDILDRVRADPRHEEEIISVETKPLSDILIDTNNPDPDFISLDIEGGEIAVLEAFPFDQHKVGAWAIENNAGTTELGKLMLSKGYKLIEFCGPDEVYAHESILSA